ncbi:Fur-regulated basic protein FbpA [Bacillus sp. JJ1566]|uniref:Fur-regulated basic protein FbpA n=1 Tax=Bacillus sp. JJ1566 TaxID=3122961 RepID=UPI002FFE9999
MNLQATQLTQAVEQRKDELKASLMKMGYFKTPDKKQLYELTLSELEQIYENVKCQYSMGMTVGK